jgi:hypothetical protein
MMGIALLAQQKTDDYNVLQKKEILRVHGILSDWK